MDQDILKDVPGVALHQSRRGRWAALAADPVQVHAECFAPLWFLSTCSADSRCLPPACIQCLLLSSHVLQSEERHLMYRGWFEDLLSLPQQARSSEKEQPKRDQFYEWLLGVPDKKKYNFSWTQLLNPLLSWIHKMYGIFKSGSTHPYSRSWQPIDLQHSCCCSRSTGFGPVVQWAHHLVKI